MHADSGYELTAIISCVTHERKSLTNPLQTPDSIPAEMVGARGSQDLSNRESAVWPSQSQRNRKRKVLIPPNKPFQGSRNDKNVRCQRQLAGAQTDGARSEGNCHFLSKGLPSELGARGPGTSRAPRGQRTARAWGPAPEPAPQGRQKLKPSAVARSRKDPLLGPPSGRNWGAAQQRPHTPCPSITRKGVGGPDTCKQM